MVTHKWVDLYGTRGDMRLRLGGPSSYGADVDIGAAAIGRRLTLNRKVEGEGLRLEFRDNTTPVTLTRLVHCTEGGSERMVNT